MFKKVKYVIRFYAEQVNQITEKQGHSKHGEKHEADSSHSDGAAHGPAHHHNPHQGHNHSKRGAGAHHHAAIESHHEVPAAVEKSHDHHGHTGGKHDTKNDSHKKNKDNGIETILSSIQARLESIEASVNKK